MSRKPNTADPVMDGWHLCDEKNQTETMNDTSAHILPGSALHG